MIDQLTWAMGIPRPVFLCQYSLVQLTNLWCRATFFDSIKALSSSPCMDAKEKADRDSKLKQLSRIFYIYPESTLPDISLPDDIKEDNRSWIKQQQDRVYDSLMRQRTKNGGSFEDQTKRKS